MIIKIAAALTAALAFVSGCAGDECTRAADHYLECFPDAPSEASTSTSSSSSTTSGGVERECTGTLLCHAKCVNETSCEALQGHAGQGEYLACIDACTEL